MVPELLLPTFINALSTVKLALLEVVVVPFTIKFPLIVTSLKFPPISTDVVSVVLMVPLQVKLLVVRFPVTERLFV